VEKGGHGENDRTFHRWKRETDEGAEPVNWELYRKIGQLNVELDWLKKKAGFAGEGESYVHRTR